MTLYIIAAIYLLSYAYLEYDCIKRHKQLYFIRVWKRYDHTKIAFYFRLLFLIALFPLMALLFLLMGDN